MSGKERKRHAYIGDGVYAEFDGFGIWLRTGNHQDSLCDNKIYLEPSVLNSLNLCIKNWYESKDETESEHENEI